VALVFLDLDGTLLAGPGAERRFAGHLLHGGVLGPPQLLQAGAFALRWWVRYGRHVWKKNKAYLAGLDTEEVARRARDFVDAVLVHELRPAMLARVSAHRAAGDACVLLTGAPDFLAVPLGRRLGLAHVRATGCARRGAVFSHAPPCPHPFGAAKLSLARALCAAEGVALDACTAYGDSIHDLALLSAVGHGVAVHPDGDLAAVARQRGWECLGAGARARARAGGPSRR